MWALVLNSNEPSVKRHFWDHWENLNTTGYNNIEELLLILLGLIWNGGYALEKPYQLEIYTLVFADAMTWYVGFAFKYSSKTKENKWRKGFIKQISPLIILEAG